MNIHYVYLTPPVHIWYVQIRPSLKQRLTTVHGRMDGRILRGKRPAACREVKLAVYTKLKTETVLKPINVVVIILIQGEVNGTQGDRDQIFSTGTGICVALALGHFTLIHVRPVDGGGPSAISLTTRTRSLDRHGL